MVCALAERSVSTEKVYAYSAYGEIAVLGPDGGNALRYTGREDDGSGLFYYRARYYDPVLKRFVTEDPIGLEGGINLYTYVRSNPVGLNDPTGESPACAPGDTMCQMAMRNAGIQNPAPMSCMEKCMASKLGLMAVTSAGRQAGFTLAQRYGGAAVATVVGIAGSTWTSAAAMLALPYLGFLADQCQQQCGLQCGGPPNTLFFNAP
jgi:RHS repeat-associated protein